METNNIIDILKHISLTHRNELHQRKKYEYLVLFSYISLIAGAFCFISQIQLDTIMFNKCFLSIFFIVIVIVFEYLIFNVLLSHHDSNHCNKMSAELSEIILYRLIRNENINLNEIKYLDLKHGQKKIEIKFLDKAYQPYNPFKCWVFGWQFLFTLIIAGLLCFYFISSLY